MQRMMKKIAKFIILQVQPKGIKDILGHVSRYVKIVCGHNWTVILFLPDYFHISQDVFDAFRLHLPQICENSLVKTGL